MNADWSVDSSKFLSALKDIEMNANELLQVEGAGAYTLINGMRMRVPVATSATKNSIQSHLTTVTNTLIVDEVGPETDYAPNIEYGHRKKDNYPAQPFIRPTAISDLPKVISAIGTAFGIFLVNKWPR